MRHTALWSLALLAACGAPTEIVLVGTSSLPAAALPRAEIVATSSAAGATAQRRCLCLDGACGDTPAAAWPLRAGLQPGRDDDASFTLELRGGDRCDDTSRLTQRARLRFRPGRRLLVRMSLDARCLTTTCDAPDSTCREGVCVPIDDVLVEDITGADPALPTPPDLLGADLATASDFELGPSVFGPVVIARHATGYVAALCENAALRVVRFPDGGTAITNTVAVGMCGGMRPAILASDDPAVVVVAIASATGPAVVQVPTSTGGFAVNSVLGHPNVHALHLRRIDADHAELVVRGSDGIRRQVLTRATGYAPELGTVVGGSAGTVFTAVSGTAGEDAVWLEDSGGARVSRNGGAFASPGPIGIFALGAAVTLPGWHALFYDDAANGVVRYRTVPVAGAPSAAPSLDLVPPLALLPRDLHAMPAGPGAELVYTDGVTVDLERVAVDGTGAILRDPGSRVTLAVRRDPAVDVTFADYAAASATSGRVVWLEGGMAGATLRSRLR